MCRNHDDDDDWFYKRFAVSQLLGCAVYCIGTEHTDTMSLY